MHLRHLKNIFDLNSANMKKLHIILAFILIFSLSGCEQLRLKSTETTNEVNFENVDALVFGMSRGFCAGKCFKVYKVDDAILKEDVDVQRMGDYSIYEFNGTEQLTSDKFEIAKDLTDMVSCGTSEF